jgi:hypothetical protein
MRHLLRSPIPSQRGTVIASYLGWTLDAFDFFILVFVLKDVALEFHTDVETVTVRRFQETGSVAPGQMGGHKPKAIAGEHHVFLVQRINQCLLVE